MKNQEPKRPDWAQIRERLQFKLEQKSRLEPKLQNKITSALIDRLWENKVKEFQEFWLNSEAVFNNCCEVILQNSAAHFCEMDFSISKFISSNGSDNLKVGTISSKEYGQIIFLAEQDVINFQQEFNIVVTRYGLNDQLGNRIRSKRLAQEYTPITISNHSDWTSQLLSKEKAERIIYGAIIHLISAVPLYKNSDIQFGVFKHSARGERPTDSSMPSGSVEEPK